MYDIILGRNEEDRKKYGTEGTIFIGKHYVKMGQVTSLSNKIHMDVARSHVVFICGKRGCLTEDTNIFTDKGYIPIKEFDDKKDKVYSYNVNNSSFDLEQAELISYPIDEPLIKFEFDDDDPIITTSEHPLLIFDGNKSTWKEACDISMEDKIIGTHIQNKGRHISKSKKYINNSLKYLKIKKKSSINGIKKVYDLIVPKNNSFIANGIVSHNSGKSYTMGVIAESIYDLPQEIKNNLAVVMLDTMGIYWTMKYPNKKDKELLDEWGLEAKPLNVNIFTPIGYYKQYKDKGIPTDFPFSIKTSELEAADWCMTFDMSINSPFGVLIESVIDELKEKGEEFDIDDIIKAVQDDERSEKDVKNAVENRFLAAKHWGLFSKQGTLLEDLVIPGQITVLDVSCYASIAGAESLRALVIGLVAEKLFLQRMVVRKGEEFKAIYKETHFFEEKTEEEKEPLVWLIIDEAHEFLPNEGKTVATQPLITILREGRQPGISLVLASQQPGKIHTDVMTQADVVIAHRITANIDVQALGMLMQSYMREGLDKQLNILPRVTGSAIIFDDVNEKMYPMRVRPRYTWHGGAAPSAIVKKKEIFQF